MYKRPDYATARKQAGFSWHVGSSQGALRAMSGIPIREFNLEVSACAEAYRLGRLRQREIFGDEVGQYPLLTPAISYGHVNCLGSELIFPEGGEVAHTHVYGSLAEGVAALQQPVDWLTQGLAPFYLRFRDELQSRFPGETARWCFGAEGPVTTAYELRGDGFFTDIFDDPPLAREFMRLTVDSILDFDRVYAAVNEQPFPNPGGGGMCDDLASFIPPRLFREFVLPYWDQLYTGLTSGTRSAHVEDLRPEQLPYLEDIGLSHFDPSISPRLTPKIFHERCRVPFTWRLGCFHLKAMDQQEVEDFVFVAAADGASGVSLTLAETICDEVSVAKARAFMRAGAEAKAFLEAGGGREELRQRASAAGRETLWDGWCGFLGPNSPRGGRPGGASAWGMRCAGS
ncbi:MAG: uroporphyrinogen decarboxylase family protein [Armatimonadetes bacterium]|nr:uroporphyrinogen decarboxylase family protein [Armatimonadota bacterium]